MATKNLVPRENNEGNIKKLLKRAPLKILLLFMVIGAALIFWIVR